MSNVTPVPESRGVPQEVIVEEQEQDLVQEFLCDAELEPAFYDEQDRWEEEPVQSVADTASELQSQGTLTPAAVRSRRRQLGRVVSTPDFELKNSGPIASLISIRVCSTTIP